VDQLGLESVRSSAGLRLVLFLVLMLQCCTVQYAITIVPVGLYKKPGTERTGTG